MVRDQDPPPPFSIAVLAAAGGVGVETIRFYQRRTLLPVPSREHGARRYGTEELRRLRFIRRAQAAGFTLEEIGELIALDAGQARDHARGHARERTLAMARGRLAELDARIRSLLSARTALRRLAAECGTGGEGPCPILESFALGTERPGAPDRAAVGAAHDADPGGGTGSNENAMIPGDPAASSTDGRRRRLRDR